MEVAGVLVDMAYESALEREKDELAEVRAKLAADDDEAAGAEEAEADRPPRSVSGLGFACQSAKCYDSRLFGIFSTL